MFNQCCSSLIFFNSCRFFEIKMGLWSLQLTFRQDRSQQWSTAFSLAIQLQWLKTHHAGPNFFGMHIHFGSFPCVFSVWEVGSGQKMCHSSSATLGLASPPVQDPGRQVSHILFDGVLLLDQGLPLGPMSTMVTL